MVKRAKLQGQGRELFFNQKEPKAEPQNSNETKKVSSKRAVPGAKANPPAAGDLTQLVTKVEALKKMVAGFKQLADPEDFKKLTLKDLQK